MNDKTASLKYPRRVFTRKTIKFLGRFLLKMLAEVEIKHPERLPSSGPIILAGNHAAATDAVMMAVLNPGIVEFLGTGDIPFDPNYSIIANSYGVIPVNRGNLDRQSLYKGLDVLKQEGILGIFPEGGIWDPANMTPQIGVAWLSHQGKAPILPIGFSNMKDSLKKALTMKHPKLVMNVGELMPPVSIRDANLSLKDNLQQSAAEILRAINALVPASEVKQANHKVEETYQIEIEIHAANLPIEIPGPLSVQHGSAYAHFLYNPTLIDVLNRNLHLPLKPLKNIYRQTHLTPVLDAWQSILNYLEENPGFFTYRFGMDEGLAVKQSLEELILLGSWVDQSGYALSINPIRRYRNAATNALVIEKGGYYPLKM
jgi:1-acyl-sn-glycerol-3-phosphate acyltransferase